MPSVWLMSSSGVFWEEIQTSNVGIFEFFNFSIVGPAGPSVNGSFECFDIAAGVALMWES